MKLASMLKASSFAHLLGLPKAAKAEEDDDNKKQGPDESDDDYAKRMEDEEKKDDEDGDGAKGTKADDDGDGDAEDDPDDKKKVKKAKKAEDGDDDDDEGMKAARKAERKRCAAIFGDASAGTRPDLAAHLAFNTSMSATEAIELLKAAAVGGRGRSLADRMATVTVPNVGAGGVSANDGSAKSVAAQILAAGAKRRGEK
jgi:hypothetical protein